MSYTTTLKRVRLAIGTAKVLGAPATGNPTTSDEAKALGEALIHLLPDAEARLEAWCLSSELIDLADAQRDSQGATRLKLDFTSITHHVEPDIAQVAALLAGFWDRNAETPRADDWRDYPETGLGQAGLGIVEVPAHAEWTGRQFLIEG